MNRPAKRPEEPMSLRELHSRSVRHFVIHSGERCTDQDGTCKYDHKSDCIGCFVGIHLTHEDAKDADYNISQEIAGGLSKCNQDLGVLEYYFDFSDPNMLRYLRAGQKLHDSTFLNGQTQSIFRAVMTSGLAALEVAFNLE